LDASEILADLVHVEEKTIGRRGSVQSEPADPPEYPNELLSIYRSTKRRIEEAFYTTRSFVEDKGRLIVSEMGVDEGQRDIPISMTSRVGSMASYDFTNTFDEESDSFQGEHSSQLSAIVVIDTVDEDEVRVDNKDRRVGSTSGKLRSENNPTIPGCNMGRKFKGLFGKGDEKQDDDFDEPPILHIYTMDGHTSSFEDDFTRSSTWNSVEAPKPDRETRRTRRTGRRSSSSFGEDIVCCSANIIP
jgi:hypothetical protein